MKSIKIIALTIFSIFLFSCENNNDPIVEQIGKWRLINVSGGESDINHNFEGETITWEFNSKTNKVTVVNNNTNPDIYDGHDSGSYSYGYVPSDSSKGCPEALKVGDIIYGCVTMTDGIMTFTSILDNGYVMKFQHIQTN